MLRWLRRPARPPSDRDLVATFRRALLAVLDGDYDRAETLITEAVQADSEDIEPYRSLARLYRVRGDVGRAIRIHQNLLLRRDLEPEMQNVVLAELAADFRAGGFGKRAIASYQEVVAHQPRNAAALEALRDLHAEAGDFREAIACATRLAKTTGRRDRKDEAGLWVRLAASEHEEGRHDAARKALKKALRRDPSSADARMLLGELEAERGRNKAALAAWRGVAERGGARAAEAHEKVRSAFAALGRARDSETFVRGILAERADDKAARIALSTTLASRGDTDPALLELRRVLDGDPGDVAARVALGRLLLSSGRDPEALKEYGELLAWLAGEDDRSPGTD